MKNLGGRTVRRIDNLIILSLCALIFGLPFSISIIEIAATVAIVLWIFKKIIITRSLRVEDTPLNVPTSVYFLFVLFSIYNSKFLMTSLIGFGFKSMEHFLLFVVIMDTVRTQRDIKKLVAAVLLSCCLIGVDGIWQYFQGHDFLRGYALPSLSRVTASFKFPNGFGAWLVTVLPICISLPLFANWRKPAKLWGGVLSLLVLACLFLTFTRAAWLSFLPAIVFIVWKKGKIAKNILLVSLVLIILSVGLLFVGGSKDIILSYTVRGSSIAHRAAMNEMCWRMFLDHPFFGHGINTFMSIYAQYLDPNIFGLSYAHNCYMQIAVETGIFSLLAFLWIIAVLFSSSSRNINQKKDGFVKATQIGILAGLLAYLIQSALETNLYALQLAILFYYFLGLAAALLSIKD